jgi:hypothetical protein
VTRTSANPCAFSTAAFAAIATAFGPPPTIARFFLSTIICSLIESVSPVVAAKDVTVADMYRPAPP